MRFTIHLAGALLLAMACAPVVAGDVLPIPPSGVIGTDDAMLSPDYWVARADATDQVILDRNAIDALNARLLADDPSMHDLSKLGDDVTGEQVRAWIAKVSKAPAKPLYDEHDRPLPKAAIDAAVAALALDKIPARAPVRYGLVTHRVSMRNLPTALRVFPGKGLQDFEQFQESTLFPGDPVAIVHADRRAVHPGGVARTATGSSW